MNSPATGLKLSAIFFAIFALVHLFRLVKQFDVVVGSHHLPLSVSVVALIVAGTLSIWMWKLSSRSAT